MNQNRAIEFLCSAKGALPLLGGRGVKRAEDYLNLAIDEVQELLDRIAELEKREDAPGLILGAHVRVWGVDTLNAEKKPREAARGIREAARNDLPEITQTPPERF